MPSACANQTTYLDALKSAAVSINEARQALEPLTDANCIMANQLETAINPKLVNITTQVCSMIKALRPSLDSINESTKN